MSVLKFKLFFEGEKSISNNWRLKMECLKQPAFPSTKKNNKKQNHLFSIISDTFSIWNLK